MHRDTGALEHRQFPDLLEYLRPGDVMVFNQSRVIPARLYGHRTDTGSKVEFLLLRRYADATWQAMARPGRRLRAGVVVEIEGSKSLQSPFTKGRGRKDWCLLAMVNIRRQVTPSTSAPQRACFRRCKHARCRR